MRRVPELDALRGLAVGVVLVFHLDPLRYFPGWSGVDLFFVLSGYLITAIVIRPGAANPTARPGDLYARFFARRALRIWPLYYLILLGLALSDLILRNPEAGRWVPTALVFGQNTAEYAQARPTPMHPAFDQTWTLAIEEQFYLVWPLAVLLARRYGRFYPLCGLVIAVNFALRSRDNGILPNSFGDRLLVTRSDGFALGALLADALHPGGWASLRPRLGRQVCGGAALAALGFLVWGCWTQGALGFIGLPTPSWPAATILAFSLLYAGIIGMVALESGARWLAPLRFGPLVYLGRISYGVYMLHVVVYWIIDGHRFPGGHQSALSTGQPLATQAVKLALSVAAAAGSWHLIEQPILRWKDRLAYSGSNQVVGGGDRTE